MNKTTSPEILEPSAPAQEENISEAERKDIDAMREEIYDILKNNIEHTANEGTIRIRAQQLLQSVRLRNEIKNLYLKGKSSSEIAEEIERDNEDPKIIKGAIELSLSAILSTENSLSMMTKLDACSETFLLALSKLIDYLKRIGYQIAEVHVDDRIKIAVKTPTATAIPLNKQILQIIGWTQNGKDLVNLNIITRAFESYITVYRCGFYQEDKKKK